MKLKPLFLSMILTLSLISCGPVNNDDSNSLNGDNTSDVLPSEDDGTTDPNLPLPIKIEATMNKDVFVFGENINFDEDFTVKVTFDDKTTNNMKYDSSARNGWHFLAISDFNGQSIDSLPQPFNALGIYKVRIGATYNHKTVRFNKIFNMEVKGGSYSSIVPDTISVRNKRITYTIGSTFTENDLVVTGDWKNNGGEEVISIGDGNKGYQVKGIDFDITKPLNEVKTYVGKITYRGLTKEFDIKVIRFEPSEINYDYNNYHDDCYYEVDNMPTIGNPKALIVPVWFNDSNKFITTQAMKDQVKNEIKLAYLGSEEDTGWHSVNSYYKHDSYGQLDIQGVVTDWFNYDVNGCDVDRDITMDIIKTISENYRLKVSAEEWRTFDQDKNGYLDAVICIYAYPNYIKLRNMKEDGSENSNLWAYCFWLQDKDLCNVEQPGPNTFFWASYDFMYQGILDEYSPLTIDAHTYIHEMGHVLGLMDYYDYNQVTTPAGKFSMQDHNVGGHDPFSKLAYGWVDPFVPKESVSIELHDFDSTGELILLGNNFDGSPFNEYLLLEFYNPTGLNALDCAMPYMGIGPAGPDESGLRVWHVDARLQNKYIDDKGQEYFDEHLTTRKNPDSKGIYLALTNTTEIPGGNNEYCCEQEQYRDLDLLALLNQYTSGEKTPYGFNFAFSNRHLWQEGDTFSMEEYAYSFPKIGKMDTGEDLGFSFEVLRQTDDVITVNIVKE